MDIYKTILTQFKNIMGVRPVGFVKHLAKILAGTYTTLDNLIQWVALQVYPTTASDSETTILGERVNPLEQWATVAGLVRKQATQTLISVNVTNSSTREYKMPAGTRFIYSATGNTYASQQEYVFSAGQALEVELLCDSPGTAGNMDDDQILEVAEANAYVFPEAQVVETLILAEDVEDTEALRSRVLSSLRNRGIPGGYADYSTWATEVEGVIAAFPYRGPNPGEVKVYVRDRDGIPSSNQLTEVEERINLPSRRPVGAVVSISPVTEARFSFTVKGLNPDTEQVRQAIETSLTNYLYEAEPYVTGFNFPTLRKDRISPAAISGEVNTAVVALGATLNKVDSYKDIFFLEEPYSLQEGEIAKLAQVSYVR